MKIAIIEVYPNKTLQTETAIDAHLRNSIILAEHLNADLLCVEDDFFKAINTKYDAMILGYASGYAPFTLIRKLVQNNKEAVKFVLSNEYNMAPSLGGFNPFHLIANYEKHNVSKKSLLSFNSLNLNLLFARKANELTEKKYNCIYYGTFRPNRAKYFKEYLQGEIYVSTSEKNFKKYAHAGARPQYVKKLSWVRTKETLNHFRYSLYIEDVNTHSNFNNLANRYYEAGFCNNVIFFDYNCRETIRKSEIGDKFDDFYLVRNYTELKEKIDLCNKNFDLHLQVQKAWRKDELRLRETMLSKLTAIIYNTTNRQANEQRQPED